MLRGEKGITLVALIITIIILVILAAVSIAAVTNMGIVNHAVNGTQNYARAAQEENTAMETAVNKIDATVTNIQRILSNNQV